LEFCDGARKFGQIFLIETAFARDEEKLSLSRD